jgi:hypothetical protein
MKRKVLLSIMLLLLLVVSAQAVVVNKTIVEGMVVYGQTSGSKEQYRIWDTASTNFGAEQSANDTTDNTRWSLVRANHERDEAIHLARDGADHLTVLVYDIPNNVYTTSNRVSTDATAGGQHRAYDLAFEQISGDALIVYNNGTTANTQIEYKTWDGTTLNAETDQELPFASSNVNWMQLHAKGGTNEIMLTLNTAASVVFGILWDGSSFDLDTATNHTISGATPNANTFTFSWESVSGDGFAVYAETGDIRYRIFHGNNNSWGDEQALASIGNQGQVPRLCPSPTTDDIGIFLRDTGNDVSALMWNGTDILSSPPTEELTAEPPSGSGTWNFGCSWDKAGDAATFFWVDSNALLVSYFNYTQSNTSWSVTDISNSANSSQLATDDIEEIQIVEHPLQNQTMLILADLAEDIHAFIWNASSNTFVNITANPLEQDYIAANGAGQRGFAWFEYDIPPVVTDAIANGTIFPEGGTANITVNVTDNIDITAVLINVTNPAGASFQSVMEKSGISGIIHNFTSSALNGVGEYTLTIIANDTSTHRHINDTEIITFSVNATPTVETPVFNVTTITEETGISGNTTLLDGDDVVIDIFFEWFRNGSSVFTENLTTIANFTPANSTLANTNYIRGDEINFTVFVDDGLNPSALSESSKLTVANSPPHTETPVFNITTLTETTGIEVNTTQRDLDGDAADLRFEWWGNGSSLQTNNVSTADTAIGKDTLANTLFERGDEINVTVYANDAVNDSEGAVLGSTTFTVANAPPSAETPVFNITTLTENTGIEVNSTFRDPDGDNGELRFEWYRNGSSVQTNNVSVNEGAIGKATLTNTLFERGDEVNVTVFANDAVNDSEGAVLGSATLTAANAPPSAETPVFNVTTLTETSGIEVNSTFRDPDADSGELRLEWYRNGSSIQTNNVSVNDASIGKATLANTLFAKSDEINVTVFSNDAVNDSENPLVGSSTLTVANTVPTVETPVFNETNVTTETGVLANTTVHDIDADGMSVKFEWFRNGSSVFTENFTSIPIDTVVNSTLSTDLYGGDDELNVTVFANDGDDDSTLEETGMINVSKLPSTGSIDVANSSALDYAPSSIVKGDTVTFNATFNVTGNQNATGMNVTLTVDGIQASATEVDITNGTELMINLTWIAVNGTHTIRMNADANNTFDETNETNNNITIVLNAASPNEGGNSEVGGAAPPPSETSAESGGLKNAKKYTHLEKGQVMNAKAQGRTHAVKIISIYPNSVRLDIGGKFNAILVKGISKSFDLNGDGIGDITIHIDDVVAYSRTTISIREEEPEATGTAAQFFDFSLIWEKVFAEDETLLEYVEKDESEEVAELMGEINDLEARLLEKESQITSLDAQIRKLMEALENSDELSTQIELKQQVSQLEKQIGAIREEQKTLEQETSEAVEVHTEVQNKQDQRDRIKQMVMAVEGYLDSGTTSITAAAVVDSSSRFISNEVLVSNERKVGALVGILTIFILPLALFTFGLHVFERRKMDEINQKLHDEMKTGGLSISKSERVMRKKVDEIKKYIHKSQKGESKQKVRKRLIDAGWRKELIERCMRQEWKSRKKVEKKEVKSKVRKTKKKAVKDKVTKKKSPRKNKKK